MHLLRHRGPLSFLSRIVLLLLAVGLVAGPSTALIDYDAAWAKKRRAPRKAPELKIIEVSIKPIPYVPKQGDLEFTVTVDLPPNVERGSLLEVTALISSPSRTSLRFLSFREFIEPLLKVAGASETVVYAGSAASAAKKPSPRVHVTLTWDGKDHTKQEVSPGTYHYELRAKVIGTTETTPRSLTVSWPKRGTLAVK